MADYDRLSEKDWVWDTGHFVDTSFVRRVFNCFDESALETALRLSTQLEILAEPCELTALTVDQEQGDLFLRHLTALGYHHAVRICCTGQPDLRFNSRVIARLISRYIQQADQQLVILGMQGGEGDNGQTGFLVAEDLGWPCIGEVTHVGMAGASHLLEVESRIDGGILKQTISLPMVLIMGNSLDSPYLRIPTLKQKLNARAKPLTLVSEADLGLDARALCASDKQLLSLHRPTKNRSCVFVNGKTAPEQAQNFYDQYLKHRMPF